MVNYVFDFLFGRKKESAAPSTQKNLTLDERARLLLAARSATANEIEAIGREGFENALRLRGEALSLVAEFDELLARKKKAEYGAVATRIKFARRAENAGRELARFAQSVIALFDQEKLREREGKIFGRVHELLRSAKPAQASAELGKLDDLVGLKKREEESDAGMRKLREELFGELAAAKHSLELISEYERFGAVDEAAARRYAGIQQKLKEYQKWRATYSGELKAKPFVSLPTYNDLRSLGFSAAHGHTFAELLEFVKSEPALARLSASGLLEMNEWSDEKIAHTVPQVSKFRRLIRENADYLWGIRDIEKTGFLEPLPPEQARSIRAYCEKEGAAFPELLDELAKTGEAGLAKMKDEAERFRKLVALKGSAKPENKGNLSARKTELERALSVLEGQQ